MRSLLLVALAASLALACAPPADVSYEVVSLVEQHYRQRPLGGGWTVTSVTSDGPNVLVTVKIKGEPNPEGTRLALPRSCPGGGSEVWRQLERGQDVVFFLPELGDDFRVGCR